jgi:hypothetical protein
MLLLTVIKNCPVGRIQDSLYRLYPIRGITLRRVKTLINNVHTFSICKVDGVVKSPIRSLAGSLTCFVVGFYQTLSIPYVWLRA